MANSNDNTFEQRVEQLKAMFIANILVPATAGQHHRPVAVPVGVKRVLALPVDVSFANTAA